MDTKIKFYPSGRKIPALLPDSYKPASSPDVPKGESCVTCKHFNEITRYCDKWNAPVKSTWWCKAWDPMYPAKHNIA